MRPIRRAAEPIRQHTEGILCANGPDSLDHEGEDPRQPASLGELQCPHHVHFRQRFGGIPDHQGEIVIFGILLMCREPFEHLPAPARRDALQCAGQIEPHHR